MTESFDILVSGGGIAGLAASAAFGTAGYSVLCVDPAPPVTERDAGGADLRTTAILQPGRDTLEAAGLWASLAPHATPLEVMSIADAGGAQGAIGVIKSFRAEDVSDQPFGWNLPNWRLKREMVARLEALPNVTFRTGVQTTGLIRRGAGARVQLSDHTSIKARLVIAADGRDSPMRQAAGIDVRTRRYGQKALAFAVTHSQPHYNVSTEIHKSGGPFTLVPMQDVAGKPSSAVVWMDDGPAQVARAQMETAAFEREINARACEVLGQLSLASPRSIWPIISQRALRLVGPRLALIAEAAHVVPPIGAQGLNMSLKDIATLLELARAQDDPGDAKALASYERKRMADICLRVAGIDMLNRVSQGGGPLFAEARAKALEALHIISPVRKTLMRLGLGTA